MGRVASAHGGGRGASVPRRGQSFPQPPRLGSQHTHSPHSASVSLYLYQNVHFRATKTLLDEHLTAGGRQAQAWVPARPKGAPLELKPPGGPRSPAGQEEPPGTPPLPPAPSGGPASGRLFLFLLKVPLSNIFSQLGSRVQ